MAYIIFRRNNSKKMKSYCKNLQGKTHKEKEMNKFRKQKLLDIPSEIVHNHEKREHDESQIVRTTERSKVTVEVGGEKSNKDFGTKTNHSLVTEYVTQHAWMKLSKYVNKTPGLFLSQVTACAVQYGEQYCGKYDGDREHYKSYVDIFGPTITNYHGKYPDASQLVLSTSIKLENSSDGFNLFPDIANEQRYGREDFLKRAFSNMKNDSAGACCLNEQACQQMDADQLFLMSGDRALIVADLKRAWPVSQKIFQNKVGRFSLLRIEKDQRICYKTKFAGNVVSVAVLTCIVGSLNHQHEMVGNNQNNACDEVQIKKSAVTPKHPGMLAYITNWHDIKKLALMTGVPNDPGHGHEKMSLFKYETFNMPVNHDAISTVPYLYVPERTTDMIINSGDGAPRPVQVYEKAALPHDIEHIDPAGHTATKSLEKSYTEGGYICTTTGENKDAQDVEKMPDLEQEMSTAIACNSLDKLNVLPAGQPSFHNLVVETKYGPIDLCEVAAREVFCTNTGIAEDIATYPGNVNNILDKIKKHCASKKRE